MLVFMVLQVGDKFFSTFLLFFKVLGAKAPFGVPIENKFVHTAHQQRSGGKAPVERVVVLGIGRHLVEIAVLGETTYEEKIKKLI